MMMRCETGGRANSREAQETNTKTEKSQKADKEEKTEGRPLVGSHGFYPIKTVEESLVR